MQEQIEGAVFQQNEYYDEIMTYTKIELFEKLLQLEYQIDNLNEHGLGDSDSEKEKFFLEREHKILTERYNGI